MTDGDEIPRLRSTDGTPDATGTTPVTAHRSNPETTVFTEKGNTDGWIASDTTVEPKR
jgi:hypothetical protein